MANGLVIHISSGNDRHTEILTHDQIRIGACDTCDLRLRASSLPEALVNTVLLELTRANGSYRITSFPADVSVALNGEPVAEGAEIRDGDEVRLADGDLLLHFYPVRSLPAVVPGGSRETRETHVAPFIEAAAIESAATARRDDAKVFLREFTRELVREISPSTKLVALALVMILVGGVLYLGFAMFREIQRSRRLISDQGAQLGQMRDQVARTSDQLTDISDRTKVLQDSLSLAVKLRSEYGAGVCLIAGSFYFVEPETGRPLRYAEAQLNDSGATVQSGAPEALTPEGNAAVAEYEFVGTGFYVGNGFVMTNRHIAQPWIADDRAQSISLKAQPRLKRLIAYFPEYTQAIPLKFKAAAQRDDLAVCLLDMPEFPKNIPVLPLETDPDAVAVGKTVVMMGYPSGPDRLLALLDDAESRGIQQRYGTPMAQLGYLAETKRIQPLTTQGSITDLDVRRIVYDARTAEGGSGAPLFGPTGRVIGINFAVFTENQASNFAVPIRFGVNLLERNGWVSPPKEGKETETAGQSSHPTESAAR